MAELDDTGDEAHALEERVPTSLEGCAFRCRMCRCPLFLSENLKFHRQATHELSKKGNKRNDSASKGCSSFFIEMPLEWMRMDEVQGRLSCPRCSGRVGSYSWSGSQCSCTFNPQRRVLRTVYLFRSWDFSGGSWITPAFQILSSRVDRIVVEEHDVWQATTHSINEVQIQTNVHIDKP